MKHSRKSFIDRVKQKEMIKDSLKERAYIEGEIPITGRQNNCPDNLFPDIDRMDEYCKSRDYLDIACGINHRYPASLLRSIRVKKRNMD